MWKRHIDQLISCHSAQDSSEDAIIKPKLEVEMQSTSRAVSNDNNLVENENDRVLRRRSQLRPPDRLVVNFD